MTSTAYGTHLRVDGVEKMFNVKSVLRGIHLEITPGEFVAVIGKSGCGKSTLLRLLSGLDAPSAGSVRVDGVPLSKLNTAARLMFQDARLLPWKRVVDNVGLGLRGNWKQDALNALDQVGLRDRADEWPSVLSGGERQRVALARALIHRPPLLLLDEPLGALDALTRIEMQQMMEGLWRSHGFTAVLITHDVEEAVALADRVVLLEHGRVALDLAVPLSRPRQRGSAEFAALKDQLLHRVMGYPTLAPVAHPAPAAVTLPWLAAEVG